MHKVVFVTGTIRGTSSWPYLFAKGLSESGIDVTVISGYANINVSDEYREHQLSHPKEKISPSFKIIRVGSRKKDPTSLAARGIKYVHLTAAIYRELKKHKADCYLFYSTPPFLGLIGRKLAKKGNRTIYIAQDLFPDSLFSIKPNIEKTFIGLILRKMEKYIYDGNTKIITISKTMADQIKSNKTNKKNVNVIYNWADVDKLHHVERKDNKLFDEFEISRDKFIISYAGSLGPLQKIDILIDAAKELQDYSDIEFVIFGRGICHDDILKKIQNEGIQNVKLLPLQPPERISEVYSFGDIEYVSVGQGVMKMACPHKIFDIFAAGSPILTAIDKNTDIADLIMNNDLGLVVSPKVKEINDAVLEIYRNKDYLAQKGKKTRMLAEKIGYKMQIDKYNKIISDVIG
ncbi:glycosyltransferase family 4 protein [Ruminococcus albus]|uniref:Glycosyltransferase involved in cell wall bisynthesis n=1 Tax=Ruminococcus albus TaxID=1264 RepID=A0A1I1CW43_RUMAL|nr:glycosyltransferase family 4 protein [Ruminococcus albus]SFB66276.1 Glycosyltransferase involved in cell wall bisynthesis [Ruminococcus albus]